jgi:hypothetical protein
MVEYAGQVLGKLAQSSQFRHSGAIICAALSEGWNGLNPTERPVWGNICVTYGIGRRVTCTIALG